jgi:hypothetical protein
MLLRCRPSSCICRGRASARPFPLPAQNCHPACATCPACPEVRREERRELRGVSALPRVFSVRQLSATSCQPVSPSRCERFASRFSQEFTSISFHGTYASSVFILLRTLLHRQKRYLQSFHHLPHSSPETPGRGYLMIALSAKLFSAFSCYPAPNPLRIRTSAKHARKPCGIRTSKAKDLKSFRIRISGKTPGGPPRMPNQSSSTGTPACVPSASPSRQPSPTSRSASDGFRSFTPRRCRASARPAMFAAPRSGDLRSPSLPRQELPRQICYRPLAPVFAHQPNPSFGAKRGISLLRLRERPPRAGTQARSKG